MKCEIRNVSGEGGGVWRSPPLRFLFCIAFLVYIGHIGARAGIACLMCMSVHCTTCLYWIELFCWMSICGKWNKLTKNVEMFVFAAAFTIYFALIARAFIAHMQKTLLTD